MGLEALSRGAERCVFVESDRKVVEVLRQNIRELDYEAAEPGAGRPIFRRRCWTFRRSQERFDLLFVDPPYNMLTEVEVTLEPFVAVHHA